MANFKTTGINGLILSMAEAAEIPDNVKKDILDAETKISLSAMQERLKALKLYDTHQLHDSLTIVKNGLTYTIYPTGKRQNAKARKLIRWRHGRRAGYKGGKMENNDVGFVLEFGAPTLGIPAFEWMWTALELSDEEATDAAMTLYDNWLQSINL